MQTIKTFALRNVFNALCWGVPLVALAADGTAGDHVLECRRYRVTAIVSIFSVPLLSRRDAGGAYAALERAGSGTNTALALEFSAGTWPWRVHGLNRFGFQKERVLEQGGSAVESTELGFITSSPEKDVGQARSSLFSNSGELKCVLARSAYTRYRSASAIERLGLPSTCSWADCPQLQSRIRDDHPELANAARAGNDDGAFPMLYAIYRAIAAAAPHAETAFLHNGERYVLATSTREDPRTASVRILTGYVRTSRGEKSPEFRIWFEPGSAMLPLRIEFRPRSFLRLVLENDPSAERPQIGCLLTEGKP